MLEELLQDEAQKETVMTELKEWARSQGYKAPEEVDGLVRKKDELLNKISKLNRDSTSEEQRRILETITELGIDSADDIRGLMESRSKAKGADDFERQLKRLQKEAEQHKQAYESERTQRLGYAKENAIVKALKEAGVKESAFDLAYAYFDRIAKVEDNDGKVSVIANDPDGLGPSIDQHISEWAKSEKAKDYIQRPVNVGAGVTGSGDASTKMSYRREELGDPKVARQVMQRKRAGENITIED